MFHSRSLAGAFKERVVVAWNTGTLVAEEAAVTEITPRGDQLAELGKPPGSPFFLSGQLRSRLAVVAVFAAPSGSSSNSAIWREYFSSITRRTRVPIKATDLITEGSFRRSPSTTAEPVGAFSVREFSIGWRTMNWPPEFFFLAIGHE